MKQFIDFIPLLLFFIVYKLDPRVVDIAGHEVTVGGIYSATAMLIISSLVVYGALFIKQRKLEKSQWLTLIACLVFGSLTLAFHSETFLKWKAPVVNWLFAVAFIGSHFIGDRLLIKRIMGHALTLPDPVWTRLNIAWIAFFLFCGAANLFVAFTFQSYWVDFKVFGSLGMTLVFLVAQGIYLSRHLHDADTTTTPKPRTDMLYAIIATDVANSLEARLAARPAHLERLQALKGEGRIVLAGPHPAVDSNDPGAAGFTGSLIVAEFDSLSAAQAWADADPYIAAGVYANVIVKPFKQVLP